MVDQERWVLGHFVGQEGGLREYRTQPLPPRPPSGTQRHTVVCETCREKLSVVMMSPLTQTRRQAAKLAIVLLGLVGTISAVGIGNSAKEDPVTYSYPAWQSVAYFSAVGFALIGLSALAFVVRNHGTRLQQVYGSTATVSALK